MKLSNCFIYAVQDFIKNGGSLCLEYDIRRNRPRIHFVVKRSGFVYDFSDPPDRNIRKKRFSFVFYGEERVFQCNLYSSFRRNSIQLMKRRVK